MCCKNVSFWFWVGLSFLAAWRLSGRGDPAPLTFAARDFPGWPRALMPADARLTPNADASFLARTSVLLHTAVFQAGCSTWVVRWLPQASRDAHPAEDCFRAHGYEISEIQVEADAGGALWRSFVASRKGMHVKVMQRWVGADGESWSDVSSWYWAARRRQLSAWSLIQVSSL